MSDDVKLKLKHAGMQLVAGGSAGCVEVSLMHPLDLVKTRFQLQTTPGLTQSDFCHNPHYYTGVGDCMKKMYQTEGLLSFWKGILPPILVETPKRAWKFLTFEQFKSVFSFRGNDTNPVVCISIKNIFGCQLIGKPFQDLFISRPWLGCHRSHYRQPFRSYKSKNAILPSSSKGFTFDGQRCQADHRSGGTRRRHFAQGHDRHHGSKRLL